MASKIESCDAGEIAPLPGEILRTPRSDLTFFPMDRLSPARELTERSLRLIFIDSPAKSIRE